MLFAINENGNRMTAAPSRRAFCPLCQCDMVPKCGEINIWHWAHESLQNCDTWHEPESLWHLGWKRQFPQDWTEVPVIKGHEKHIADVMRPDGLVLEFQHSFISVDDIRTRERFYQNMMWVFDIRDCADLKLVDMEWIDGHLHKYYEARFDIRRKDGYCTFRWKYPRKHIAHAASSVFLDIGAGSLFELRKFHPEPPAGGWGLTVTEREF